MKKDSSFYPKVREAYVNEMTNYIRSVRRITKRITEEERINFTGALNTYEKIIYEFIISTDRIEDLIDQLSASAMTIEKEIHEIIGDKNYQKDNPKLINGNQQSKHRYSKRSWLIEKGKGLIRCLHDHGVKYTLMRIFLGKRRAIQYEVKQNNRKGENKNGERKD